MPTPDPMAVWRRTLRPGAIVPCWLTTVMIPRNTRLDILYGVDIMFTSRYVIVICMFHGLMTPLFCASTSEESVQQTHLPWLPTRSMFWGLSRIRAGVYGLKRRLVIMATV